MFALLCTHALNWDSAVTAFRETHLTIRYLLPLAPNVFIKHFNNNKNSVDFNQRFVNPSRTGGVVPATMLRQEQDNEDNDESSGMSPTATLSDPRCVSACWTERVTPSFNSFCVCLWGLMRRVESNLKLTTPLLCSAYQTTAELKLRHYSIQQKLTTTQCGSI